MSSSWRSRLGSVHRQMVVWDVVGRGELVPVTVIGNDGGNLDGQRADPPSIQQVVQAVSEAGHHDEHARFNGHVVDRPLHRETLAHVGEVALHLREVTPGGAEAHAHEEPAGFRVAELGAFDDVAGTLEQESADAGDDAHTVRTGQPQNPVNRVAIARHPPIIDLVASARQRDMINSLYLNSG